MADAKISALTAATTPLAGTEVLPIVQSGVTKKVSVDNLTTGKAVSGTQFTASTGNFTPSTAGKGMDFSANPTAPGFTTKVLADYEQGTFTPVLEGTATAGTGTYSTQLGMYTKIGNVVHFKVSLNWSAHTGTGDMVIKGLPYTTANDSQITIAALRAGNIAYTAGASLAGQIQPNDTIIYPVTSVTLSAAATIPMDTSGDFNVSGIYFTQS
jgi:hypothetical protein